MNLLCSRTWYAFWAFLSKEVYELFFVRMPQFLFFKYRGSAPWKITSSREYWPMPMLCLGTWMIASVGSLFQVFSTASVLLPNVMGQLQIHLKLLRGLVLVDKRGKIEADDYILAKAVSQHMIKWANIGIIAIIRKLSCMIMNLVAGAYLKLVPFVPVSG